MSNRWVFEICTRYYVPKNNSTLVAITTISSAITLLQYRWDYDDNCRYALFTIVAPTSNRHFIMNTKITDSQLLPCLYIYDHHCCLELAKRQTSSSVSVAIETISQVQLFPRKIRFSFSYCGIRVRETFRYRNYSFAIILETIGSELINPRQWKTSPKVFDISLTYYFFSHFSPFASLKIKVYPQDLKLSSSILQ